MFASSQISRGQRRGIVLVVVLGMLGLLALIGVTFATFSNQAMISSRNFSQAQNFPDANEVLDFALQQLINDAPGSTSVIRGHSLKRDMYGSDAWYNGALLNGSPFSGSAMFINDVTVPTSGTWAGFYRLQTNIPNNSAEFYGYNFVRWTLRFGTGTVALNLGSGTAANTYVVAETHEILADDVTDSSGYRCFYIAPPYYNANLRTAIAGYPYYDATTGTVIPLRSTLPSNAPYDSTNEPNGFYMGIPCTAKGTSLAFALDGRYRNAFNGPGLGTLSEVLPGGTSLVPRAITEYANFRYNGNVLINSLYYGNSPSPSFTVSTGDPDFPGNSVNQVAALPGMDEDYDACDLENWFLAIQTADGQVAIPSFHRPGILSRNPLNAADNDWTRVYNPKGTADENVKALRAMSRILRPRGIDGNSYVSFPDLLPDSTGHIKYDIDNDGDGTTDSVWLDLGYQAKRSPEGQLYKPLFAFLVLGLNGKLPLNTAGNLADRNDADVPVFDHTDHLGNSPSEIDLRFALQNAYVPGSGSPFAFSTAGGNSPYTQVDNAFVSTSTPCDTSMPVAVTQLRNLLAGTRKPDTVFNPNNPPPPVGSGSPPANNGDANAVMVNNQLVLLPNNVGDSSDYPPQGGGTGTIVTSGTDAVPGRWGEVNAVPFQIPLNTGAWVVGHPHSFGYPNAVRAGTSVIADPSGPVDARDDNYNTYDPFPAPNGGVGTFPEGADMYDTAGGLLLPVERMRRFVNPADITGDGMVVTYNPSARRRGGAGGTGRQVPVNLGADAYGRVAFFHYFRPPGVPIATFNQGGGQPDAYVAPPNVPAPWTKATATAGSYTSHSPVFVDTTNLYSDARTNNIYHGFIAAMSPSVASATAPFNNPLFFSGTPSDIINPTSPPNYYYYNPTGTATIGGLNNSAATAPTFSLVVNSNPTHVSDGLNEADEMDYYDYDPTDQPFGPSDLEWLYRAQDVDGPSLQSRLSYLAPISFNNPLDGYRRRRLFSLQSYDLNNYVWANDNPSNAFPYNSAFAQVASANEQYISPQVPKPSVAHHDKRINLNFPLPVSNSPIEPIRQKWVRETYSFLKAILPPRATDTPEELAQLGQYVVNIVDFRDPDCTVTKFVNTDFVVVYYDATGAIIKDASGNPVKTPPAMGAYTRGLIPSAAAPAVSGTVPTALAVAYNPLINPSDPLAHDTVGSDYLPNYLIQYGMEYQPVALNEVLAYRFETNVNRPTTAIAPLPAPTVGNANFVSGMFVELVNMLTKDGPATTPDSCDLDLAGWDFVIMPDDVTGRPDPFTGQIPDQTATNIVAYPLAGSSPVAAISDPGTSPHPAIPAGLSPPIAANTPAGGPTYYTIGGFSATATNGATTNGTFTPTAASTGLATQLNGLAENAYYWLYLRRPLNPFDPTYDPTKPNDNRVVVDSFRFVYTTGRGRSHTTGSSGSYTVQVDTQTIPASGAAPSGATDDAMFSLQRMQPYRGGHAVPPLSGVAGSFLVTAYGYSEQADVPSTVNSNLQGVYQEPSSSGGTPSTGYSTGQIYHSLGMADSSSSSKDAVWDYFPFNDRDFTSVVELLMVPGCSPGLFTKQFSEMAPPISLSSGGNAYMPIAPPFDVSKWNSTGNVLWRTIAATGPPAIPVWNPKVISGNGAPHPFPYLHDEFFYTAANEFTKSIDPTTNTYRWWREMATPPAQPPYRSPSTADSTASPAYPGNYIGGPGGAGWHKMLDFFEVPSPVQKAIAPVALGTNYDWARQDLRPGQVNINLIVDEEVFLGVMGSSLYGIVNTPYEGVLNSVQMTNAQVPNVVTQVDDNGSPAILDSTGTVIGTTAYAMNNVGIVDTYTMPNNMAPTPQWSNAMKACFSDFLKLRHGGSGYVFGFGTGGTGLNGSVVSSTTTPIASDRPFRSLSFPDIDYTIFRPATLPPSLATTPITVTDANGNPVNYLNFQRVYTSGLTPTFPFPDFPSTADPNLGWVPRDTTNTPPLWVYTQDPGVKNPYLYTRTDPVQPEPIPPRRLFQVPDFWGYQTKAQYDAATGPFPGAPAANTPPSNASSAYNASNNGASPPLAWATGDPAVSNQVLSPALSDPRVQLTAPLIYDGTFTTPPAPILNNVYLGGAANGAATPIDQRDHPYFRTEWLQKVANLTTVRTHQYAVWITVGFFEVTQPGNPSLANDSLNFGLAYDKLGLELGLLAGKNVRYRGFFLVDRTRATGFHPSHPADFRDCVLYRQIIE